MQHEDVKVLYVEDEKLDGQTSIKDFRIATICKLSVSIKSLCA